MKAPRKAVDLSENTVGLYRNGTSDMAAAGGGKPRRLDGFIVGAPLLTRNPPHGGEMHPDGDELLYLVSGHVKVVMEVEGGDETVDVHGGEAIVVPKGVWHRVLIQEPSRLVHITPGPGDFHRPPK
jgi:mannose-6-phosphate isomerase-like protein (cupin superfamily)